MYACTMVCRARLAAVVQRNRPNRIKWINGFKYDNGTFRKHILSYAIDQTIHW
jgi:hypothetical protein